MSSAAKNVRLQQEGSLREFVQALETGDTQRARNICFASVECWPEMRARFFFAAIGYPM